VLKDNVMNALIQLANNHRIFPSHVLLFLGFISFLNIIVMPDTSAQISGKSVKQELPKEKETTLGLYVSSKEAYKMWASAPEKIKILDVRTTEEYIFVGHAEMAWNVPLATQSYEWDSEKKMFKFKPNQDFLTGVKSIAAPGDTLLVMCRSGGRSAMAVNQLAAAGFSHVYNITDGMEGDLVKEGDSAFKGQRMKNGWKNAGLPWTYELDPDSMILPEK
jgi:rhodanese-related sulfurtransferase